MKVCLLHVCVYIQLRSKYLPTHTHTFSKNRGKHETTDLVMALLVKLVSDESRREEDMVCTIRRAGRRVVQQEEVHVVLALN